MTFTLSQTGPQPEKDKHSVLLFPDAETAREKLAELKGKVAVSYQVAGRAVELHASSEKVRSWGLEQYQINSVPPGLSTMDEIVVEGFLQAHQPHPPSPNEGLPWNAPGKEAPIQIPSPPDPNLKLKAHEIRGLIALNSAQLETITPEELLEFESTPQARRNGQMRFAAENLAGASRLLEAEDTRLGGNGLSTRELLADSFYVRSAGLYARTYRTYCKLWELNRVASGE